jgi:large subunit ribosomal protein L27
MAHKKAAGSAKNLRDSQAKYRGVKLFGGQKATAGNIIIRQKGSQYESGLNTYVAADFTIHALIDGVVVFKKKNFRRFDGRTYLKTVVAVFPADQKIEKVKKAERTPVKKVERVNTEKEVPVVEEVAEKAEKPAVEKKVAAKKPAVKKEPAEKKPAVKKTVVKKAPKKEEKSA